MGGRGSSSGINSISNRLAGAKVELEYALMKRSEYGAVRYGGTKTTRERFEVWNNEVRKLQKEISELEKKKRKKNKTSNVPF